MTEKRFKLRYDESLIDSEYDNLIEDNNKIYTCKEVVDLLNNLIEENEQLKQSIDRLINKYRNAMTDEPSTVNWYCNHIISDLKKLKELGD